MARNLEKMGCRPWAGDPRVELVQGDVLDLESLKKAASGCGNAYYLVHSMIAQKEKFAAADRRAAQNMVSAAADAGLKRIVYLGGLAETKAGNPEQASAVTYRGGQNPAGRPGSHHRLANPHDLGFRKRFI